MVLWLLIRQVTHRGPAWNRTKPFVSLNRGGERVLLLRNIIWGNNKKEKCGKGGKRIDYGCV